MAKRLRIYPYIITTEGAKYRASKEAVDLIRGLMEKHKIKPYWKDEGKSLSRFSLLLADFLKKHGTDSSVIDPEDAQLIKNIIEDLKVVELTFYGRMRQSLDFDRISMKLHKGGVMAIDRRFDERLEAEAVIEHKEFNVILKDYLGDKHLKKEIVSRVQGILDIIYDYQQARSEKRKDIDRRKKLLREEHGRQQAALTAELYL